VHLPLLFVGVVPLALVGTAADLFSAIGFARQDKMGPVMSICVGSSIQFGLVVAPLLVLISWAIGRPLTLVFPSDLDLFAIAGAVFITRSIASDGETSWFEGVMLVGIYVVLALAFLFAAPGRRVDSPACPFKTQVGVRRVAAKPVRTASY
jgi:Ca2+:H+ antiporter